jgi:superfamily II DNA/RNA helicase
VIMFDFVAAPSDYLHRAGRTARNGASGRVVSVTKMKSIRVLLLFSMLLLLLFSM